MKKLPCPRCGKLKRTAVRRMSRMLNPREWEAGWEVECGNCCMSSGIAQTKEKAVELWNSLPRPLRWTYEDPTEPGWYFIKYKGKVTICYADYPKGSPYMTYRVVGIPGAWNTKHADEWSGPIPEPMEPK